MRSQDTKALFPMALKLHSLFKKDRYLFWAITALHLQAHTPAASAEVVSNSMKLAEKMIVKAFSPDKIRKRSREELHLLLDTLKANGNNDGALKMFEQCCETMVPNRNERLVLQAEILERCNLWSNLISLITSEFEAYGISDWALWKFYVRAIDASADRDTYVSGLPNLFSRISSLTEPRMLHLATIDAGIIFGPSKEALPKIESYLNEYVNREVSLPDMQHIIKALDVETGEKLMQYCQERHGGNWPRIERMLRLKCGNSQHLPGDLAMQGHQLHAANIHVDEYGQFQTLESLLLAVQRCTDFLRVEEESYAARLLLILLYINLGCPMLAVEAFKALDIKQLQIDTLSYVLSDHLIELGDPHADVFFQESYLIYDDSRTSSWSLLAEAFSRESYHNVVEFYEFSRRLEYSIQAVACICGSIRFELLNRNFEIISDYLMNLKPEELLLDEEFIKNLADNRDRDVFDFCDHSGRAKELLLDKLPTFSLGSVVLHTFFPMAVRSLLTNDMAQMEKLVQGFRRLPKPSFDLCVPERDATRTKFLNLLFDGLEAYVAAGCDRSIFVNCLNSLASLLAESHTEAQIPDIISSPYQSICALQSAAELNRWLSLTLISFVKGACPSQKARRLLLPELSAVSYQLRQSQACIMQRASAAAKNTESRACPAGSPFIWEKLKLSWLSSVNQISSIVKGSSEALDHLD